MFRWGPGDKLTGYKFAGSTNQVPKCAFQKSRNWNLVYFAAMFGLLHQYLVENRSLYLRGTGQLQLVQEAATYHVADQLLLPPRTSIHLQNNEQAGSLQPLVTFLSHHLQVAEENAFSLYESFCNQLQEDISVKQQVSWSNLGVFQKDGTGVVVFQQDARLSNYNQPVQAERIIRHGATHNMVVGTTETTNTAMIERLSEQTDQPVKSRWWIAALVIGITSLLLIFLKKMQYL